MPAPRGPGPVAAFHRILIVTALAGALVFALWELREAARGGGTGAVLAAVVAFAVSGVILVYLRSLRGLGAKLTPPDDPRPGPPPGR
jgi:hypothetical protein